MSLPAASSPENTVRLDIKIIQRHAGALYGAEKNRNYEQVQKHLEKIDQALWHAYAACQRIINSAEHMEA